MSDVIPGLISDPLSLRSLWGPGAGDRMSASHQQKANQRETAGVSPRLAHLLMKQHVGAFISF